MIEYIYTSKDGRQRMVIYENGKRHTISYPRKIMEDYLGRKLLPDEDVHHIDGDVTNNNIKNLQVINHKIHCAEHSQKYFDKIAKCYWCGKEFLWTSIKQRNHYSRMRKLGIKEDKIFCSKSCSGKYGRAIQMGEI